MLDHLQPGNVVTVTRLDRLARSTRDLLDIAERIGHAEAGLRSLAEPWADTTTPAGRMVLTFFAGVAEFERSLIHERTSAGRAAAKAKGVRFGRPLPFRPSRSHTPASSSARTRSRPRLPGC
jgi:DNA invertase Pin-like site-specific DNA recombinase